MFSFGSKAVGCSLLTHDVGEGVNREPEPLKIGGHFALAGRVRPGEPDHELRTAEIADGYFFSSFLFLSWFPGLEGMSVRIVMLSIVLGCAPCPGPDGSVWRAPSRDVPTIPFAVGLEVRTLFPPVTVVNCLLLGAALFA